MKKNIICTAILFLLFIALTVCVLTVDVQPIGPKDSVIGLATLNGQVFDKFGANAYLYSVTEILGYAALVLAALFCGMTAGQFFKRKSLKKVDGSLLALMGMYGLMAFFYLLFEVVVINYRPVLEEGALAASYPSSHTMLVCTIMLSGCLQLERITKDKVIRITGTAFAYAVSLITVVGRLLSGVHWFTDILGGVLLASALVMLYQTVAQILQKD